MEAFVQVHLDGHFTNENHFLAWRGLSYFNYKVNVFKNYEASHLPLTKETPVYAGVSTFTNCLKKINIDILERELPSYPDSLNKYLGREIEVLKFKTIKDRLRDGKSVFIKPLDNDRKAFNGKLLEGQSGLDYIKDIPDFISSYVFGRVNILSEYRVFIHKQKILDSRRYNQGNFRYNIDYNIVESAIKDLENPPIAYCLDFGYTDEGKTILVEATDAWSFAPYGLDMIHFTNMIVDRYKEIVK